MFRLKEKTGSGNNTPLVQVPVKPTHAVAKKPKHGPITINAAKKITNDEQKALLIGYVVVPQSAWETVPYKSHIRYIKSDGTFVRGGFFKNFWKSKDGVLMMQLENNLNRKAPGYATWAVDLSNVQTLYKKCDKGSSIEVTSIYKKLEHQRVTINALVDAVNGMETRLKLLEKK